jgi:hypothetical protein
MSDEKLKKNLNSSGFPFQIAVENAISNLNGWDIMRREYPWQNSETGQNGYIDLIAEKDFIRLIIECKRVRDSEWIFLCSPKNLNRNHARFWANAVGGKEKAIGWYDGQVEPSSPEADFCAIMGQNHRKPLLENLASELVTATEAFAFEELSFTKGITIAYFPVIITTADLYVCKFDANDVQIESGEIRNAQFDAVPFIRFRKSLITQVSRFAIERPMNRLLEIAEAKERTLFVMNALKIKDVLGAWKIVHRPLY